MKPGSFILATVVEGVPFERLEGKLARMEEQVGAPKLGRLAIMRVKRSF